MNLSVVVPHNYYQELHVDTFVVIYRGQPVAVYLETPAGLVQAVRGDAEFERLLRLAGYTA